MEHSPEILALLSKLGHKEEATGFVPGDDLVKVLKSIRRALNASETNHETRTLLEVHAMSNHFVPLLISGQKEEEEGVEEGQDEENEDFAPVVLEVSKILVLLTLPDSALAAEHCRELRRALCSNNSAALFVLVNQIRFAISLDASKRTAEQKLPMDLLFWLMRNLLLGSGQEDADFFAALEHEYVLDICLHFARHVQRLNNREWDVLFLEIFFHFFSAAPSPFVSVAPQLPAEQQKQQKQQQQQQQQGAHETGTKTLVEDIKRQQRQQRGALPTRHSNFNSGLFQTEDKQFVQARSTTQPKSATVAPVIEHLARKRIVADTSLILTLPQSKPNFPAKAFVHRVAREFIASEKKGEQEEPSAHAALFSSLIQCIQREDTRFQPKDEVHFLWMLGYFPASGEEVDTTTSLWCYSFVVNKVYEYLEAKSWVSLELSVSTLFHLLQGARKDKAKLNLVFYELRQRLEIVPKLIRMFDSSVFSIAFLKTLCLLGNFILLTMEEMALEGAVAKAKQRKSKKTNGGSASGGGAAAAVHFNAEELRALAEGVDMYKGEYSLNVMRQILKHATLGKVFEEGRTPQLLLGKWMDIRLQKAVGKTLEQIVLDELDKQDEAENAAGEADKAEGEEGDAEVQDKGSEVKEKKVDFISELRGYLSNFVYSALSQLVDPALYESVGAFLRETDLFPVVALFFRRLRLFRKGLRNGETLEPVLWHVSNFASWRRTLQVFANARITNELTTVLNSSLRRFFRLAQANRMLYLEILFWRTKSESLTLSVLHAPEPSTKKQQPRPTSSANEEDDGYRDEDEFGDDTHREKLQSGEEENEDDDDEEEEEADFKSSAPAAAAILARKSAPLPPTTSSAKRMVQDSDGEEEELIAPASAPPPPPSSAKKRRSVDARAKLSSKRSKKTGAATAKTGSGFVFNPTKLARAVKPHHANILSALATELEALDDLLQTNDDDEEALICSVDANGRKDLCRILLLLGMRPPNRDLASKERDVFACETYWRCAANAAADGGGPSKRDLAAAIRTCLEQQHTDAMDSDRESSEDDEEEDYAWCYSAAEEEEEAEESESEEDIPVVASLTTKKQRRIVVSDSEEE